MILASQHECPRAGWIAGLLLTSLTISSAAPLQIQILDNQFSTYTYSRLTDYAYDAGNPDPAHITIVSNRLSSPQPLTDSITSASWDYAQSSYTGLLRLEAQSDANLYRLEAFAQSVAGEKSLGGSLAAALTQITFVPQVTGLGTFNIDLFGWRQYYGAQLLRLTDLTLGQEVWSYGYSGLGQNATERFERLLPAGATYQNELLWEYTGNGNEAGAQLHLDTFLTASSTYELTLFATVESQAPETERVIIEWTGGPMTIPEPASATLVGFGALALLLRRKSASYR
jgi:hypothetical protein